MLYLLKLELFCGSETFRGKLTFLRLKIIATIVTSLGFRNFFTTQCYLTVHGNYRRNLRYIVSERNRKFEKPASKDEFWSNVMRGEYISGLKKSKEKNLYLN